MLGQALRKAGNVILPIVFEFDQEPIQPDSDYLDTAAFVSVRNPVRFNRYNPITARRVLVPVPSLIRAAMTLGHINMSAYDDGTLRWETLVIGYHGSLYPSLALQAAAAYLDVSPEKIILNAAEGVQIGERQISTDRWGRTLINYYGPNQTFPHISISDILEGNVPTGRLKGKIVLVGATAAGIYDLRVTPLSPALPGVEKHASVIASILDTRTLAGASLPADLMILIGTGLLFALLIARGRALGAVLITAAAVVAIFSAGYFAFTRWGLLINLAYPSLNILFIFVSITAHNHAVQERYARRIRLMFSSYVTERVVDELIRNPEMARIGGERREITVLFSDIRGFTAFSEQHPPEEVVAILNEYLKEMTGVVFKWEGTLDKFIGDGILAFWGAPMRQEEHAELAVRCALDMMTRLANLQMKWEAEGKPGLEIGIGINTGEVIVGNIGAEGKKTDYTVIGDHVNLGSRVESLTKKYNAHILMTEFVLNKLRNKIQSGHLGNVCVRGLERVIVKGRGRPVGIYEITALDTSARAEIIACPGDEVVTLKEK